MADDVVMRSVRAAFAAGTFAVMLLTHVLGLHGQDCPADHCPADHA